ncbi:MAG TPA: sigma-70 family RNA polymerase sigma factor [Streptosporangiaceae bacterium]
MAQALHAREGDAVLRVYDGYADRLYDYCHALLRDQRAAAGALHDALVVAHERIEGLTDPELFRGWLYAIVRNECLRRLYDPARPAERQEAPEIEDPYIDFDERARREEARQLVHSALSGLNGRQREAVDLALRHELEVHELAGVLGLPPEQAGELVGQARATLDDALAAAIIARSGRGECPSVAALVDTWEWPLTPAVCRKLIRHIETCPVCGERRKRRLSTPRLLQTLPVAALPPDLRQQVHITATAPDLQAARAEIAQRAEPFDDWGWPASLDRTRRQAKRGRQGAARLLPALAAAACVLFVVGAVFLYLPRSSDKPSSAAPGPTVADTEDSSSVSVSPSEDDSLFDTPTPTDTPTSTPPTTRTPTVTSRPASTRPTTRRPSPRPTTPKPATVTVTGCDAPGNSTQCTVSIAVQGGTVTWSASGSGVVSASGSGTLRDGERATVTATINRDDACNRPGPDVESGAVVFTPGGSAPVTWNCF